MQVREPNLRYLALESMSRLAAVPAVGEAVSRHFKMILGCLKDNDVSIRRRALGLLFVMAGSGSAPEVRPPPRGPLPGSRLPGACLPALRRAGGAAAALSCLACWW